MGSTNQLQIIDVNKLRKQQKKNTMKVRLEMGYTVLRKDLKLNNGGAEQILGTRMKAWTNN